MNFCQDLIPFLQNSKRLLVITGAGISTESGIPDYRSPGRVQIRTTRHQEFMKSSDLRKRYWARSLFGFEVIQNAKPNSSHLSLAKLEKKQQMLPLITQNVDSLHQLSGHQNVIELHGTLFKIVCMSCGYEAERKHYQQRLKELNSMFYEKYRQEQALRPDGDVELPDQAYNDFQPILCDYCRSDMIKPKVVFYGDNVPSRIKEQCSELGEKCDSLLILGSTLETQSAFRIVKQVKDRKKNIVMVNIGKTRADHMVDMKIEQKISTVFADIEQQLFIQ